MCLAGIAMPALAQIDSYRPGAPYSAVPAQAADQCVAACSGDAACRGWNFVTIRKGAAVCEFLSRDANPVPSAGSVSGVAAHVSGASSRLVRTAPSPAVRVGQPAPVKRVQAVPSRKAVKPAVAPTVERRVAAPVRQRVVTPRFRHALEGAPIGMAPPRRVGERLQTPVARGARPPVRPLLPEPITHEPITHEPMTHEPVRNKPPVAKVSPFAVRPGAIAPDRAPVEAPVAAPVRANGLFGSLYDDVAVPSAVDVGDLPEGAPIATTVTVTVPVAPGTVKGLAGG